MAFALLWNSHFAPSSRGYIGRPRFEHGARLPSRPRSAALGSSQSIDLIERLQVDAPLLRLYGFDLLFSRTLTEFVASQRLGRGHVALDATAIKINERTHAQARTQAWPPSPSPVRS
jgi:hypothetical protein